MHSTKEASRWRLLVSLPAIVFLGWQAWLSGTVGIADVHARPAIRFVDNRFAQNLPLSPSEWRAARDAISSASELVPGNPWYYEHLAKLEELRFDLLAQGGEVEPFAANDSTPSEYFLAAIGTRPTHAQYWAGLAKDQLRSGDYSSLSLAMGLVNAVRFGPFDKSVQQSVAEVGSEALVFLSVDARQAYIVTLDRILKREKRDLRGVVRDWQLVCTMAGPSADELPSLFEYCANEIGSDV